MHFIAHVRAYLSKPVFWRWVLVVHIARTYHIPRWRETWVLWGVKCLGLSFYVMHVCIMIIDSCLYYDQW